MDSLAVMYLNTELPCYEGSTNTPTCISGVGCGYGAPYGSYTRVQNLFTTQLFLNLVTYNYFNVHTSVNKVALFLSNEVSFHEPFTHDTRIIKILLLS
jgi:hypothetical protein